MLKSGPLVSVVVSVYNGEDIIENTLRSVMEQKYYNMQIIVVNDGSNDKSGWVIKKLAQEDDRIEILDLDENSNICNAMNLGYELVRGKYLALIGHDDIWKADKIGKQVEFMENNKEYAACFTLVDVIDEDGEVCNNKAQWTYDRFNQENRTQKEWVNKLLFEGNFFCAPSVLLRKECIPGKQLFRYGLVQVQDYALWLDILGKYPVYVLQERLTMYRRFLKSERNLSQMNEITRNRLDHENSYVGFRFIKKLPDEAFKEFFAYRFRNQKAITEAELKCERGFLLLDGRDVHAVDYFMELLEDKEMRDILNETYHFSLNDFYNANAKHFSYDRECHYQINQLKAVIDQLNDIVEQQGAIIEYVNQNMGAENVE